MSSPHAKYEIRTVADFQKVPDERLDVCLDEFADFVRLSRVTVALFSSLAGVSGGETFHWIDDGERRVTVRLEVARKAAE